MAIFGNWLGSKKKKEDIQRVQEEEARRLREQEEASKRAQEEAVRREREEAERRQKEREAALRRAQEELIRRAQEEAAKRAQEEAARRAQEEADKRAQAATDKVGPQNVPEKTSNPPKLPFGQRGPKRGGPIGGDLSMKSIHYLGTKVIVDGSAVGSPGFKTFAEAYRESSPHPNRFLFIPEFGAEESGEYAAELKELYGNRTCIKWDGCSNYDELFAKRAALAPFLIVINNMDTAAALQQAALKNKLQIRMVQLADDGMLKGFFLPSKRQQSPRPRQQDLPQDDGFRIATTFERFQYAKLPHEKIGVGSVLKTGGGSVIRLDQEISHNENSITYRIAGEECAAKIFSGDKQTTLDKCKVERMMTKPIDCEGLCWPKETIVDNNGTFVGYKMNLFKGIPLNLGIFHQEGLRQHFPSWGKAELSQLAQTIMIKVNYMHTHGILFGGIEPASIWVRSEEEVYFLDTDRYQIEGFPSLKYSYDFCAPESVDKNGKLRLVTLDEERFAVAELAFKLIMNGKTAYPSETGGDALKNIREMRFAYSWDGNRGTADERRKLGTWRYVWSHLSPGLKETFYKTFMASNLQYKPYQRKTAHRWSQLFANYAEELNSTDLFDLNSRMMFPPSFKRSPKDRFIRCVCCGVEHPDWYFREDFLKAGYAYCRVCLKKPSQEGVICKNPLCKRELTYNNQTAIYHRIKEAAGEWTKQKWCSDRCRQEGPNVIYKTLSCKNCGRSFDITYGDYYHYTEKGLSLPKKCGICRGKKY